MRSSAMAVTEGRCDMLSELVFLSELFEKYCTVKGLQ